MKLEGIGKYVVLSAKPCLGSGDTSLTGISEASTEPSKAFETFSLDFGSVAVGHFSEKFVKVTNISQVR